MGRCGAEGLEPEKICAVAAPLTHTSPNNGARVNGKRQDASFKFTFSLIPKPALKPVAQPHPQRQGRINCDCAYSSIVLAMVAVAFKRKADALSIHARKTCGREAPAKPGNSARIFFEFRKVVA